MLAALPVAVRLAQTSLRSRKRSKLGGDRAGGGRVRGSDGLGGLRAGDGRGTDGYAGRNAQVAAARPAPRHHASAAEEDRQGWPGGAYARFLIEAVWVIGALIRTKNAVLAAAAVPVDGVKSRRL